MIKLKSNSVNLSDVHPKIYHAISIVADLYANYGSDLVLTSVRDSKHMDGSLHYVGKAFDCRVWNLPKSLHLDDFRIEIRNALGDEYDVVYEINHYHIEYDPE